jgi:enoyl-CoA hydratase/carnithine racemase
MEMLLTGEMIDADAAAAIGLVNRVTAPGQALSQAMELGRRVAAGSASAIARGKQLIAAQACLDLAGAYDLAGRAMALDLMAPDAAEGITAFLDRRPARFEPRAGLTDDETRAR